MFRDQVQCATGYSCDVVGFSWRDRVRAARCFVLRAAALLVVRAVEPLEVASALLELVATPLELAVAFLETGAHPIFTL